ncbi:MAG: hypothetical protein WKF78_04965 [Candidatus Limnocylindrales bacterium]
MAGLLAIALSAMSVGSALAWSNGPDSGNGYGTHDWIVDQALKTFSGKLPAWFEPATARLASDDPDSQFWRTNDHVYREIGYGRGAVHQVAEYYARAIADLKAGNGHQASVDIGRLAHFYGDILVPFHTAYAGASDASAHSAYERLVDSKTKSASSMPEWQTADRSPGDITDVRATAIAAAAYSRKFFPELYSEFTKDQSVLNARLREITGYVLKRASRELGEIIHSIDRRIGNAPLVVKLVATVKYRYPDASHTYQSVYVTATDASGRTIEGLQVSVTFPSSADVRASAAEGTQTFRAFSMPDGIAKATAYIDPTLHGVKLTVKITATMRGSTVTTTTWYQAK